MKMHETFRRSRTVEAKRKLKVCSYSLLLAGLAILPSFSALAGEGAESFASTSSFSSPAHLVMEFGDSSTRPGRSEIRESYKSALQLFNQLELDSALSEVENGIQQALGNGAESDPVLASLYVMKAALIYSTEGDAGADRLLPILKQAVELNFFISVPIEMSSEGLSAYLKQARGEVGTIPDASIEHNAPMPECGEDIYFEARMGVPEEGQAALYWRTVGGGEYRAQEMELFANVAETSISATMHGDENIEYFFYVFDDNDEEVANLGSQEAPMTLDLGCSGKGDYPEIDPEKLAKNDKDRSKNSRGDMPKFWVNLGLGFGLGIARGEVENTYSQFFPGDAASVYDPGKHACAIARWQTDADASLPPAGDAQLNNSLSGYGSSALSSSLSTAYGMSRDRCAERQAIQGGLALAPFHLAPEFAYAFNDNMSIGLFSRLQVANGTRVFRDNPSLGLDASFNQEVRSTNPKGVEVSSAFAWALGVKFRYFFGKASNKFRPLLGGFAGYGNTRLRVDLGFGQDRNGNSVPDDQEVASYVDPVSNACVPVWPYNNACESGEAGDADRALAQSVRNNASSESRVDTVRMGPVFFGALVGFNYQIHRNFALFGELQVGGWLPNSGSVLFDINVGPALTF